MHRNKFTAEFKELIKAFSDAGVSLDRLVAFARRIRPKTTKDTIRSWVDYDFAQILKQRRDRNNQKYKQRHSEKYKEIVAENNRRQRRQFGEELNARTKKWKESNAHKVDLQQSAWWKANKQKVLAQKKSKKQQNPAFRLLENMRTRLSILIKTHKGIKEQKTVEYFGCTLVELLEHLESQFEPGMSWENYGKWHVDHIIPCSSFNHSVTEEVKKCWHFSNLQPLWAKENLVKSNKIL